MISARSQQQAWLLGPVVCLLVLILATIIYGSPPHYHIEGKLSDIIEPSLYRLTLVVDSKSDSYTGQVDIHLTKKAPLITDKLFLHVGNSLYIDSVELWNSPLGVNRAADDTNFWIKPASLNKLEAYEILEISFDDHIKILDDVFLRIYFTGLIQDDKQGLVKYKDEIEQKEFIMSITGNGQARQIFPCFDEAKFRARFELVFNLDIHLSVKSNTNIMKSTHLPGEPNRKLVKLSTTNFIAPDQVKFIIGVLNYGINFENKVPDPFVITRLPGNRFATKDLINIIRSTVRRLKNHLGIDYDEELLDIVLIQGLPRKFWFDGPGIIVMSDSNFSNLDYQCEYAARILISIFKQSLRSTITFDFPQENWFIEGLSDWYAFHLVDNFNTKFNYRTLFMINWNPIAIKSSEDPNFPKLISNYEAWNPLGVHYNALVFKSSALFRMMDLYCGRGKLPGLGQRERIGETMSVAHLIQVMSSLCGHDFEFIFERYLTNPGVPLLEVSLLDSETMMIKQQVMYSRKPSATNTGKSSTSVGWPVPVNYIVRRTGQSSPLFSLFKSGQISEPEYINLNHLKDTNRQKTKINAFGSNFHRTIYTTEMITDMLIPKNIKSITITDRFNLVDDANAAFEAGYVSAYYVLNMVRFLELKHNIVLVQAVIQAINNVRSLYRGHPIEKAIEEFGLRHFGNFHNIERLDTYSNTPRGIARLKLASRLLISWGSPEMINRALEWFHLFVAGVSLDPEIIGPMFQALVRSGESKLVVTAYIQTPNYGDKIAEALGWCPTRQEYEQAMTALAHDPDHLLIFLIECLWSEMGRLFVRDYAFDAPRLDPLLKYLGLERTSKLIGDYCIVMHAQHPQLCNNITMRIGEYFGSSASVIDDSFQIEMESIKRRQNFELEILDNFLQTSVVIEESEES